MQARWHRTRSRTPLVAIGVAVALAIGCGEEKTKVEPLDLTLDTSRCFGDLETSRLGTSGDAGIDDQAPLTTCRRRLDEVVAASAVNACLLIQHAQSGAVHYVPLRWAGSELVTTDDTPSELSLGVGDQIRAELYLHGDGFDASTCAEGGIAFGSPCDETIACVVKFVQSDLKLGKDGTDRIDFSDGAGCATTWSASLAEGGEQCDGKDNDCDARVDEDFSDLGDACTVGVGACQRTGRMECTPDETGTACSATPGEPEEAEVCDDIDNDCNGQTDEGLAGCCQAGQVQPCGLGVGVCVRGQQSCIVDEGETFGHFGACVDGEGNEIPTLNQLPELCDGIDNDCDGATDEDFAVGDECTVGEGDCRATGTIVCQRDGTAACNATPGSPQAEVCDGRDNNCDGTVDDGLGVGAPCEAGVGGCRREGVTVCGEGGAVVCGAEPGEPGAELCGNQIDDDCDGTADEGFDDVGDPCTVGVGACEQAGNRICDPNDLTRTTCNRQARPPSDEVCDNLDNDCDGEIDEDFDLQDDPENCGVCGNVCAPAHAVPRCEGGICTLRPEDCIGGWRDADGDYENGCECNPDDADPPDPGPAFTDSNCDGVDGDADRAIFVSVERGSDDGIGSVDAPYRTLARAVTAAAPLRFAVYVDAGEYDLGGQTLVVPTGVNIHGGYRYDHRDHTWARDARDENATVITGAEVVLRYENLQHATMLDNVIVRSLDAGPGRSSVGIQAVSVGDHLTLRNVRVEAGNGGPGIDGEDGASGPPTAQHGVPGKSGLDLCAGCGGAGGQNPSCPEGTAGGDGGDGGRVNDTDGQSAVRGQPGSGPGGGAFGPGGGAREDGGDGGPGADGAHGTNSPPGEPGGRIDPASGIWLPRASSEPGDGEHGSGGGGGGGGGPINLQAGIGGGGGGGGAGGCGGRAGGPATGGGGSFALQVTGGTVHLQRCVLRAGNGGAGGTGGTGGAGAPGGNGNVGGGRGNCPECGVGGHGGNGGRGGCGGNAGGAAGGPSFALFRVSTDARPTNLARSQVVYEDYERRPLPDAAAAAAETLVPGQGGDGGAGGQHPECGQPASAGDDGYAGREGCCRRGPPSTDCGDLTDCRID